MGQRKNSTRMKAWIITEIFAIDFKYLCQIWCNNLKRKLEICDARNTVWRDKNVWDFLLDIYLICIEVETMFADARPVNIIIWKSKTM